MVSHRLPNKNLSKNKELQAGGAQRNDSVEDVGMVSNGPVTHQKLSHNIFYHKVERVHSKEAVP